MHKNVVAMTVAVLMPVSTAGASSPANALRSLEGTWVMDSAYEVLPDGKRITTYGDHPLGILMVDATGRYTMQIFKIGRPAFASGDKARGTAGEYRAAVAGSSTHFGRVSIDRDKRQLVFDIQAASFPNWEGKRQIRDYTYERGLLHYAVPSSASSSGIVAHSLWRRADP